MASDMLYLQKKESIKVIGGQWNILMLGRAFTAAMQHFLIVTADAIAEDLAIWGFTAGSPVRIDDAAAGIFLLRQNRAAAPPTRDNSSYYPLEELI